KLLVSCLLFVHILAVGIAKAPLNITFINDFSLAFVPSSQYDRSLRPSGPFICPSSAYPNALGQFQFTSDVISGVKSSTNMWIQYYAYTGGDGDPVPNKIFATRDNFTETAIPVYTKFCSEGPEENDFERCFAYMN
ncbi:hypothetical protein PFISCL1PPCAC_26054, partial [Pristionchus fissidentatus]